MVSNTFSLDEHVLTVIEICVFENVRPSNKIAIRKRKSKRTPLGKRKMTVQARYISRFRCSLPLIFQTIKSQWDPHPIANIRQLLWTISCILAMEKVKHLQLGHDFHMLDIGDFLGAMSGFYQNVSRSIYMSYNWTSPKTAKKKSKKMGSFWSPWSPHISSRRLLTNGSKAFLNPALPFSGNCRAKSCSCRWKAGRLKASIRSWWPDLPVPYIRNVIIPIEVGIPPTRLGHITLW